MECLGLNKSCSDTSVRKAYERVLNKPVNVGYGEDILFHRAVLLRDARECLRSLPSRRAYDSSGCNLAEMGDSSLVVELGSSWLQQHADDLFAPDVARSIALARYDEAAAALDASGGTVVLQACRHLEAALQLLRDYDAAENLQHLIIQTLEDHSPGYALELLALPLQDVQPRQRGFRLLRKLVFGLRPEESPVGRDRDGFMRKARAAMMPQELLRLYEILPSGVQLSAWQQLDVALATVAIGYQRHQPHLVQRADSLFQQLGAGVGQGGQPLDVSVDRAACALLLGNIRQSQELVGLSDSPAGQQAACEDIVREYVLAHSPDSTDLLPGLCMLSQSWLQEAIVDGFRPDAFAGQEQADLGQWFDDRKVQALAAVNSMQQLFTQTIPAAIAAACVWLLNSMPSQLWAGPAAARSASAASLAAAVDGQQQLLKAAAAAAVGFQFSLGLMPKSQPLAAQGGQQQRGGALLGAQLGPDEAAQQKAPE
ncbi:hypothetical protein COO60DRAFT_1655857 [Scenedesmus sp. NREL 46B-D3]|nr:hypothetical protein COO60DRAFT_1655857 [Scenedesmus sp. NREL 46B-D3]